MIRVLLIALAVLALGAMAAFYLRAETGYVLISFHHWIVETSLLGLIGSLALILLLLGGGLRLLLAMLVLPMTVRRALAQRRERKAQESFEAGLLRLLEGNWKRAEIELVRRAADHHAGHLNYLAAARAAQQLGAGDRRDHYLRLASEIAPEMEFATLLTQAELQLERGQHTAARDTALKLRGLNAQHPYALELLALSYAGLQAHESLRQLLLEPGARALLSEQRYTELLTPALLACLRDAREQARLERLKTVWDSAPRELRQQASVRNEYLRGLARLNAHAEALALISEVMARDWDATLATLYGELHSDEPLSQLAAIESWLLRYGERPELLITAGRVCLRNKLWGKSRSYLDAVLRVAPSPAAYLELARLSELTQNSDAARQFYKQGLEFTVLSS
ncbi:HemY protein [Solimonas aquatica]|uniref:HemY protein n=1 Tax=Solimonas aquatica TaxID=489703 RepID=A0A1H9GRD6_9GAMM|nr:heme biosynthesis HemY N-terminal domain-containing protein [Solimonas aquatica]SEQ52559.1 HemY protein [Solimonas aquatica]